MEGGSTYTRHKLTDSVFFRVFIISFCILVPVNLLLIAYAVFSLSTATRQIYAESENVLKMYVNQLDMTLDEMNTRLYRLTMDSKMLLILQSDSGNADSDIEWYGAWSYIYNRYSDYLQDYTLMDGLFCCIAYDSENREFVICSSNEYRKKTIHDQIVSRVNELLDADKTDKKYLSVQWEHMSVNGEDYFFSLRQRGKCYFGGWFKAADVLKRWNLSEEEYFFLNGKGEIMPTFQKEDTYIKARQDMIVVNSDLGNYSVGQKLNNRNLFGSIPVVVTILCLLSALAICMIPTLVFIMKKYVIRPVDQLIDGMKEVELGNFDYQILDVDDSRGEFVMLMKHFNMMAAQIHDLKIESYEKELERQRIKMQYLSQQIQPHFILNTLNILYCYGEDEFTLIQDMLLCLSRYFRYIVKVQADFVELGQELAHIKNYLTIQKVRYPERFDFSVHAAEGLEKYAIPPLLIQNFTENAIKYSVSMNYRVRIDVIAKYIDAEYFQVRISDTGKGLPIQVLKAIEIFRRTHQYQEELGVGFQNAMERLDIMYQGKAEILFYNSDAGETVIELRLPCIETEEAGEENG